MNNVVIGSNVGLWAQLDKERRAVVTEVGKPTPMTCCRSALLALIMAPIAWGQESGSDSAETEVSQTEVVQPAEPAPPSSSGWGAELPQTLMTTPSRPTDGSIVSPEQALERPPSWVDTSHGFFTERADNLTRWFDSYFGDTEVDQEAASSRLRLRLITDWDERLGTNYRVRVGGKVNLPAVSRRLDLVFRGDDPADDINGQEDRAQSRVGLQYQLGSIEPSNHRFDLTLGASSSGPRPGVKYRYRNQLTELDTLRVTQRFQYELDEGTLSTTRLDIDHQLSASSLLRSYSRVFWSEESQGFEWSTSLSHVQFWSLQPARADGVNERALMVYAEASGVTEPYDYVSNYRLGLRYRRQTYRDYLFVEVEPSYNWRIDEPGLPREGAWKVELRFEFLLFDDLRKDAKER